MGEENNSIYFNITRVILSALLAVMASAVALIFLTVFCMHRAFACPTDCICKDGTGIFAYGVTCTSAEMDLSSISGNVTYLAFRDLTTELRLNGSMFPKLQWLNIQLKDDQTIADDKIALTGIFQALTHFIVDHVPLTEKFLDLAKLADLMPSLQELYASTAKMESVVIGRGPVNFTTLSIPSNPLKSIKVEASDQCMSKFNVKFTTLSDPINVRDASFVCDCNLVRAYYRLESALGDFLRDSTCSGGSGQAMAYVTASKDACKVTDCTYCGQDAANRCTGSSFKSTKEPSSIKKSAFSVVLVIALSLVGTVIRN